MKKDEIFGYSENPPNGSGISRSKTSGLARIWYMPRSDEAYEVLKKEFFDQAFPALYILFEGYKKAYVGEAKDIIKRIKSHKDSPDAKIKNWSHALIINDGRPASFSELNDQVVRRSLEFYVNNLLKYNNYDVISRADEQEMNANQKLVVEDFKNECQSVLIKKNIINRCIQESELDVVYNDELRKTMDKISNNINNWSKFSAEIDGVSHFFRQGTLKPGGLQITFRGTFLENLKNGKGMLVVQRKGLPVIPLKEIREFVGVEALKQDTIDIWINHEDDKITLKYKKRVMDITKYKIAK